MTIDQRLEAVTMNLELASHDIQDLRGSIQDLRGSIQDLQVKARQDGENIAALARTAEIHDAGHPASKATRANARIERGRLRLTETMTLDERLEAITMDLELASRDIQDPKIAAERDGENIRALARIAEMHERRLSHFAADEP